MVLDDEDLEKRKDEARSRICSSRTLLISEVRVWRKAVLKYKTLPRFSLGTASSPLIFWGLEYGENPEESG